MAHIKVQTEDFDIGAEIAALTAGRTDIGGIGCFGRHRARRHQGIHRHWGSTVTGMTLEHYPGMTERAIARIVPIRRRTALAATGLHGDPSRRPACEPGENIVLVIAASAHRQAASGCDRVPDRLAENQGPVLETRGFHRRRGVPG